MLTAKGLVPEGFIEEVTRLYENDIGPLNGAKVVARAWVDPEYRIRLLHDGTAAVAELGFGGPVGNLVAVENKPGVHNVVVCTLCSCYPWSVLGLPPAWYEDAPYRARLVRERHLRRRRLADGAGELTYRSTLAEVAEVYAIAQGFADRRFASARAAGARQAPEAYLADGLLDAVRAGATTTTERGTTAAERPASLGDEGESPAPTPARPVTRVAPRPHKVIVRIDWDALVRGQVLGGEVCEIAGLGPVPVATVRQLVPTGDAFLAAVATKGVDVATVAHLGRRPTAFQQTALQWRDPVCAVQGCSAAVRLEYDHVQTWAETRFTLASLLERACPHHHDLKSHQGWDFVAGAGKRPWFRPTTPATPATPRDRRRPSGDAGDRGQGRTAGTMNVNSAAPPPASVPVTTRS